MRGFFLLKQRAHVFPSHDLSSNLGAGPNAGFPVFVRRGTTNEENGMLKAMPTGEARSRSLPEIPTLQESGFTGLTLESWYAAFAPLGTPSSVITRLNSVLNKALADTGTRDQFLTSATEPVGGASEALAKAARNDFEKYARLISELNIRTN
jgi:tripartite-type tricarboxylate transporter receptor subunit TctC